VGADRSRALSVAGSRPIKVGALARVEFAGGRVWSGRVSYVSGELVGLKSPAIVPGRVANNETVTLVVGEGESMVAAEARVLAASGSFMRLSRRESSEGLERRRALRVPLVQPVSVSYAAPDSGVGRRAAAELTDMSASGCAVRAETELPVGKAVSVSMRIVGTDMTLSGKIVRAWRSDEALGEHAGIQFDPLPAATTALINRYLVEQLRETSNPDAAAVRRPAPPL
jgi:hypothetical protein